MRSPRRALRLGLAVAALLAPLAALLAVDLVAAPADPAGRWRDRRPKATLVLTGLQRARIKPCGCTTPQNGGFERQGPLFEPLRRRADGRLAVASLGGFAPRYPTTRAGAAQLSLKADLYRAFTKELGYDLALLSVEDLNVPELVAHFGGSGPEIDRPRPPINLKPAARLGLDPAATTVPWVEHRIGEVPVRLLGVIDESHAENLKAAGIADQVIAPATALQGLQGNAEVLWVIAVEGGAGTLAAVKDAARLLGPAVVVDLSGSTPEAPHEFVVLGKDPLVVAFQDRGMSVGILDVDPGPDGKGWTVSYHPQALGPDLDAADSPSRGAVAGLLSYYNSQVREQRLLALEERVAEAPGAARYVGSAACARCHSGIYADWAGTPHAKALTTLRKKDYEWDPECLVCHVVGPRRDRPEAGWSWSASGFVDPKATPFLGGVGCESCHGPGSLHVAEPWKKEHFAAGGPNRRHPGERGCMTCHDVENSPGFLPQYAERVRRVDHRDVPADRRTHEPPAK